MLMSMRINFVHLIEKQITKSVFDHSNGLFIDIQVIYQLC